MSKAVVLLALLVLAIPASAAEPTAVPTTAEGVVSTSSLGRATIDVTSRRLLISRRASGIEVTRSRLYDRRGRLIGSRHLFCIQIVSIRRDCSGTFLFPRGTIVVAGTLHLQTSYVLAVTGGTGLYDNARGSLSITRIHNDPKRDRVFIQLVG